MHREKNIFMNVRATQTLEHITMKLTFKSTPHSSHWLSCHVDVSRPGVHVEVHDLHSAVIRNSPPLAAVLDGEAQRAEERKWRVCLCVDICKSLNTNICTFKYKNDRWQPHTCIKNLDSASTSIKRVKVNCLGNGIKSYLSPKSLHWSLSLLDAM